jgi:hypothetical protein
MVSGNTVVSGHWEKMTRPALAMIVTMTTSDPTAIYTDNLFPMSRTRGNFMNWLGLLMGTNVSSQFSLPRLGIASIEGLEDISDRNGGKLS